MDSLKKKYKPTYEELEKRVLALETENFKLKEENLRIKEEWKTNLRSVLKD